MVITIPPVANLRRTQAKTEPSNWANQYKMLLKRVMFPPKNAPNVTAGFTCPPDMFAPTETATINANAWPNAAIIKPSGVANPSFLNLPATLS